jgi:hypothetical protein
MFIPDTCVGLRYGLMIGAFPGDRFSDAPSAVASDCQVIKVCHLLSPVLPIWFRNINLMCIAYSLRPQLSSRLTQGGRTLPWKPYPYGGMDFNHAYRYLCLDTHFQPLHRRLPLRLHRCWNALLPLLRAYNFGSSLSPDHLRRELTR